MYRLVVALLVFCVQITLQAGEYNQVLSIGDKAPEWKQLPGVDGKEHSMSDLKDAKVVVVAYMCNSCPYASDVEQRLIALTKNYRNLSVAVVAINVNKVPEDLMPEMKVRAQTTGYNFPYLFDSSQQIARDYGAIYTPEFYVLNQQRKIVYMGAMDDSPDGKNVTTRYVRLAVDAALTDSEPKVAETVPIGCRVRYDRRRRSRRSAP